MHCTNFNIRFYPLVQEARARVARRRARRRLERARRLPPGLAARADRLELAARAGAGRRAARGRRHRLALARPRAVRHRPARRRGLRRPRDRDPGPAAADGRGRDVRERAATSSAWTRRCRPRTSRTSSSASRTARAARSSSRRSRGPQELAPLRGRRLGRARSPGTSERHEELWLGHRDRPNELLFRDPALMHAPPRPRARTSRSAHAEGFADTFRELYRAVYADVARGGPPAEPDYPTFADGHVENVLGEPIALSQPRTPLGGGAAHEARPADRGVPAPLARAGRRLGGGRGLRDARGRVLARRRAASAAATRASHIDVDARRPGAVRDVLDRHGLEISSLAYYPNNLHPDPAERRAANTHLRKVIDAAAKLGVGDRRHVRRPRQDEERARQLPRVPQGLAAARRLRRRRAA